MDITFQNFVRFDSATVDGDKVTSGRLVASSIVVPAGYTEPKRSKRGLSTLTLNAEQSAALSEYFDTIPGLTAILGADPVNFTLPEPGLKGRTITPNVGEFAARLAALNAAAEAAAEAEQAEPEPEPEPRKGGKSA